MDGRLGEQVQRGMMTGSMRLAVALALYTGEVDTGKRVQRFVPVD